MIPQPNAPCSETVVRPSSSTTETRFVIAIAVLTLLISSSSILMQRTMQVTRVVSSWQIDAFNDLCPEDLALFNALYTAAPEIIAFHEETGSRWPTVAELAQEYIPPFVQDAAWQKNGSFEWIRSVISTEDVHIAWYLGNPLNDSALGSFLLVMLHKHVKKNGNVLGTDHAPFEVWYNASSVAAPPEALTDQALINSGWREVVARRGETEMLRRKDFE